MSSFSFTVNISSFFLDFGESSPLWGSEDSLRPCLDSELLTVGDFGSEALLFVTEEASLGSLGFSFSGDLSTFSLDLSFLLSKFLKVNFF